MNDPVINGLCAMIANRIGTEAHFLLMVFERATELREDGSAGYRISIYGDGIPDDMPRALREMADDMDHHIAGKTH